MMSEEGVRKLHKDLYEEYRSYASSYVTALIDGHSKDASVYLIRLRFLNAQIRALELVLK